MSEQPYPPKPKGPPIKQILANLRKQKSTFDFFDKETYEFFFSAHIKKVDELNKRLVFNNQGKCHVEKIIEQAENFRVQCKYKEDTLQFDLNLIPEAENNSKTIFTDFPINWRIIQQREAYRLKLKDIYIAIEDARIGKVAGLVCDLSVDGVLIEFEKDFSQHINVSDVIDRCFIQLTAQEIIVSPIVIRRIEYNCQHQTSLIGGEFVNFPAQHEKILSRFIFKKQRERIKRYMYK